MMFGKKKRTVSVDGRIVELQPKPVGFKLFSGGKKRQPSPQLVPEAKPQQTAAQPKQDIGANLTVQQRLELELESRKHARAMPQKLKFGEAQRQHMQQGQRPRQRITTPSRWRVYVEGMAAKHKGLEDVLKAQGIKSTPYEFVQRMIISSMMLAVVIGVTVLVLFARLGLPVIEGAVLGVVVAIAIFYTALGAFLNFPATKGSNTAKNIERDILFAVRDMIISLRSGMPLFNAITSISTGYGDASKEFAKIVERVQLGSPLEEAIDRVVAETKSATFRRIMLQAVVSIRAGADVINALQSVIDQVSEERIIELRRYGQKLNAIAMFYMLFGIILPSMGIAVVTILTTFISIFTVTNGVLAAALVMIFFLQIIFLRMVMVSRPVFTM
ncbi:MAG: type II secretion system F family protein [Candidatus Micrarchaeota archaeon]|nr:type II secretion system F family protein [Candidatus Micrarchaeota archaeon]